MTPERRDELILRTVGVVVVVAVAFALAGLTWRIVGWDDGRSSIAVAAVAPTAGQGGDADVAAIVALAPFGLSGQAAVVSADSLGLVLKGILMAYPAEASTALIAIGDGRAEIFGPGQSPGGGAVIESIEMDRVILNSGGQRAVLAFPQTAGSSPTTPATGPGSTTAAATGVASTPAPGSAPNAGSPSAPLPKADFGYGPRPSGTGASATAAPPPAAGFAARMGVTETGGGYRLGDALSAELRGVGLRPGDVVETLNGQPVGNMGNDRQLFERAVQSGGARVEVVRDGRRLTLTFPLR